MFLAFELFSCCVLGLVACWAGRAGVGAGSRYLWAGVAVNLGLLYATASPSPAWPGAAASLLLLSKLGLQPLGSWLVTFYARLPAGALRGYLALGYVPGLVLGLRLFSAILTPELIGGQAMVLGLGCGVIGHLLLVVGVVGRGGSLARLLAVLASLTTLSLAALAVSV